MALHNHLLVRGHTLTPPKDAEVLSKWLISLVDKLGMKLLQGPFVSYVTEPGNRGITAVVMIETSHIAIHVWDEDKPALVQFDVYTCGDLDIDLLWAELHAGVGIEMGLANYIVLDRSTTMQIVEAII